MEEGCWQPAEPVLGGMTAAVGLRLDWSSDASTVWEVPSGPQLPIQHRGRGICCKHAGGSEALPQ